MKPLGRFIALALCATTLAVTGCLRVGPVAQTAERVERAKPDSAATAPSTSSTSSAVIPAAPSTPPASRPKSKPTAKKPGSTGIYTPSKGSSERAALMDAARVQSGDWTQRFTVYELHVLGSWAVGELSAQGVPHSPLSHVYAWHEKDGHWTCLMNGGDVGEGDDPKPAIRAALRDLGMPKALVSALQFR